MSSNLRTVLIAVVLIFSAVLGPALPGPKVAGNHLFTFRILAILLLPLIVLLTFTKDNFELRLSPEEVLFIIFGVYLFVMLSRAPTVAAGLSSVAVVLLPVATAILIATSTRDRDTIQILFGAFLMLLCISIVIATWEMITGHHLSTSRIPSLASHYSHRASAWYYNSNDFSAVISMLSPLVLIKILYGDRVERVFAAAIGAGICAVMYQNFPRAALFGTLVATIVCVSIFLLRQPLRSIANGVSTILLLLPLLGTIIVVGAVIIFGSSIPISERSVLARWRLLQVAIETAANTVIGSGLANFQATVYQSPIDTLGIVDPHSWLTWLLGVVGVPGTILFMLILGTILRRNLVRYLVDEDPINLAAIGIVVAFSIAGIGPSNVFHMEGVWILTGLLVAVSRTTG